MTLIEDPVCGMEFTEEEADTLSAETTTHEGETYYFCSGHCLDAFEDTPSEYLD